MSERPTLEAVAEEIRQLHEDTETMTMAIIQWRLRESYRWVTGTDPWPDTRG